MKRYVLLYQDEDGAWIAEVPSLPGCISNGNARFEVADVRDGMPQADLIFFNPARRDSGGSSNYERRSRRQKCASYDRKLKSVSRFRALQPQSV